MTTVIISSLDKNFKHRNVYWGLFYSIWVYSISIITEHFCLKYYNFLSVSFSWYILHLFIVMSFQLVPAYNVTTCRLTFLKTDTHLQKGLKYCVYASQKKKTLFLR
jgi:hypothetical protein